MLRAFAIIWLLSVAGHASDVSYGEFTPYVKSFIEAGQSVGVKVDMNRVTIKMLGELPRNWVGVCNMDTGEISILEPAWVGMPEIEREVEIWHELGHCVLGRYHDETVYGQHPKSIMYPNISPTSEPDYYIIHRLDYIYELFK
jgi:hypothetical protein